MLSSSPQVTISLWQPLHLRVWCGVVETAGAAWQVLVERRWRGQRQREWSALDELSPHTLKDIGAPDWVVLDASERVNLARQRLDEFSHWRGV
jgi:uncharacterized protein YjiS (DUF1127 family)